MMENIEINSIIKAKVIDVKPYAAFLEFENGSKGLLHISEISDKFIRDILSVVSKGDEINVLVLSIDKKDGFIRCSLKRVPEENRMSTHKNERKRPNITEKDFSPLKEKLPEWIAISLEEKKNKEKKD